MFISKCGLLKLLSIAFLAVYFTPDLINVKAQQCGSRNCTSAQCCVQFQVAGMNLLTPMCKNLSTSGHHCSTPTANNASATNVTYTNFCPCQSGLTCQARSTRKMPRKNMCSSNASG